LSTGDYDSIHNEMNPELLLCSINKLQNSEME
jgi:hypothetical protein